MCSLVSLRVVSYLSWPTLDLLELTWILAHSESEISKWSVCCTKYCCKSGRVFYKLLSHIFRHFWTFIGTSVTNPFWTLSEFNTFSSKKHLSHFFSIPGVDCVEGDECLIVCKEGFELNPMPKRDNGLQCTCNTIKCKWTGQGRKLVDHTCVPKKSVRIINGEDGERGKDGYTISLGYYGQNKENKKEWIHFCGGVLLTSQWGITAAHCQQRNLKAMIGEYKLNEREGSEVLCRVQKQIRHPQYDFRTQNDVMMINVKCNKLEMGKFIYPARLPAPGVDPKAGDNCRICGWGNTDYPTYVPAKTLQCVTLPVIDTDTCNGPDHYINSIHDKIMCIGNLKEGGKDSCQGDSGGPANCGGIIHGIVMGGLYCAKPNYPGVYTRTNRYIDWMKSTISENSSSRKRSNSRGNRRNKGRRYGGK